MKINFSHPLNKIFIKIINNINIELKSFKKTKLNYNFLINELKGILPNKKTLGYYVNPKFCINIDNYDQYLLSKIKTKKKFK